MATSAQNAPSALPQARGEAPQTLLVPKSFKFEFNFLEKKTTSTVPEMDDGRSYARDAAKANKSACCAACAAGDGVRCAVDVRGWRARR